MKGINFVNLVRTIDFRLSTNRDTGILGVRALTVFSTVKFPVLTVQFRDNSCHCSMRSGRISRFFVSLTKIIY